MINLQKKIDKLKSGGTLQIAGGDYSSCVIRKPVTLVCDQATFWSDSSAPAMKISSKDVVIQGATLRNSVTSDRLALEVEPDCNPQFENLRICGTMQGMDSWLLPLEIATGKISKTHPGFFLDFGVPCQASILSKIAGISLDPSALSAGINSVKLKIADAPSDSIILGEIEVHSNHITWLIPFSSQIEIGKSPSEPVNPVNLFHIADDKKLIYQKTIAPSKKDSPSTEAKNSPPQQALLPLEPAKQPEPAIAPPPAKQPEPPSFKPPAFIRPPVALGNAFASHSDATEPAKPEPAQNQTPPPESNPVSQSSSLPVAINNPPANSSGKPDTTEPKKTVRPSQILSTLFTEPS